jgi:hypothetical protein
MTFESVCLQCPYRCIDSEPWLCSLKKKDKKEVEK